MEKFIASRELCKLAPIAAASFFVGAQYLRPYKKDIAESGTEVHSELTVPLLNF